MGQVPKMPEAYKGDIKKGGGYTKTAPRDWTPSEVQWVKDLLEQGYTAREIAESVDRTHTSVAIKVKRMGKQNRTYNARHIDDKYQTNADFINYIKPTSAIDVYAGTKSFYSGLCEVTANDKNEECDTDYHMDALKFCCTMYVQNAKADIVDLDPFGSAYDCLDLAIKMATKGLVVTFGELGHKRWKRLDFVRRYYGIERLEDFTLDALVQHVQAIGRRNKKDLKVFAQREWQNIGRVWFEIQPLKITEQWAMPTVPETDAWML